MQIKLPEPFDAILKPLFDALPIDQSMGHLLPDSSNTAHSPMVAELIAKPEIAAQPPLVSGLWLYVDELDKSHTVSQSIEDPTGSFWHGIMHRREGDFSNSHYWFRKVDAHPAFGRISDDYDPHTFIDEAEKAHQASQSADNLVVLQRREWMGLFEWCAEQAT